jgi:hypothetical protein
MKYPHRRRILMAPPGQRPIGPRHPFPWRHRAHVVLDLSLRPAAVSGRTPATTVASSDRTPPSAIGGDRHRYVQHDSRDAVLRTSLDRSLPGSQLPITRTFVELRSDSSARPHSQVDVVPGSTHRFHGPSDAKTGTVCRFISDSYLETPLTHADLSHRCRRGTTQCLLTGRFLRRRGCVQRTQRHLCSD